MAEEYYVLKRGKNDSDSGREPALLLIFDTGYYTIVTGWGELFDIYCRRKQLGTYTGRNVKPRKPGDADYGHSRLHILPFDHAFAFIKKEITDSNCVIRYLVFNNQLSNVHYKFKSK